MPGPADAEGRPRRAAAPPKKAEGVAAAEPKHAKRRDRRLMHQRCMNVALHCQQKRCIILRRKLDLVHSIIGAARGGREDR